MAKFAKRHYETIATAMQAVHPGDDEAAIDYHARVEMWRDVRTELAQVFALDNQSFKRGRFEQACEPGGNVRART
jgi:hypothetical protein